MKITMTTISEIQCARFIYTNGRKIAKQFNIQKDIHLAKSKTICVTFHIQEARYFTVICHEISEVGIYVQKV